MPQSQSIDTISIKNLAISPKKVTTILTVIVLSLTVAHIIGQYYKDFLGSDPFLLKIVDKLDLDIETNNLPNWYQSSTLLLCSFLLGVVALLKKAQRSADIRYWGFLAVTFLYLSVDELVAVHEHATVPLRLALDLHGLFYLSWVIPAAVCLSIFVGLYLKFLWRLPAETRWVFIISGTIYVAGAVGLEMISARFFELNEPLIMDLAATGPIVFQYALLTGAEEFLEMTGIVIFLYGLLSHIGSGTVSIQGDSVEVSTIRQTDFISAKVTAARVHE